MNQLYGVDINPFPAQLSSINLAVRNLKVASRRINLVVSDFFKVKPSMGIIPKNLDVVMTNPPYTRQEEMEYKDQIREEALTYSDVTKIDISAQAGIYTYFFTHSAKFLKNKGRMGYITSNTWLDVSFGKGLKQFFLDHFKIITIIEHDAGVFEKAVVDTCVVILEKAEGDSLVNARNENVVKFVRLKKSMDIKDIVKLCKNAKKDYEDSQIRIALKKQLELQPRDKWGKYLRAPTMYGKIANHPKMIQLKEIANVRRGVTTGAEDFFYLDREKIKLWGIEKKFFSPIITEPAKIFCGELQVEDVEKFILEVQEEKEVLKKYNVLKYIEWGEEQGFHKRRTVENRRLWYNFGKREPAPIIFSRLIRQRPIFVWNKDKIMVDDSFYEITPKNTEEDVLLAILNSTLTSLFVEVHGRQAGAGLLAIQAYELEEMPILDPNKLSEGQKRKIVNSFMKLCLAQRKGIREAEKVARTEIDEILFDVLDLSERERKQVNDGLEYLRQMRLQRRKIEMLVETAEKWKPHKKPKKEKITKRESSKRLDTWIKK